MTFISEEKPNLYSKLTIFIFSLFLSTLFGALLLAQNLNEAVKKKERFTVVLFAIIWNVTLYKLLGLFISNGFVVLGISNSLGGLILIFPFWNYYLYDIVDYERKKIWGPLIFSVVLIVSISLFLFLMQPK